MTITGWDGREGVGRYIDELAGSDAKNATIAQTVNERVLGSKFAGALVGRWRRGEIEVSPGNLAALARAYGRNPVEAFVVARLLEFEDAQGALDPDSLRLLARVRTSMTDLFADIHAADLRELAEVEARAAEGGAEGDAKPAEDERAAENRAQIDRQLKGRLRGGARDQGEQEGESAVRP